MMRKRNCSIVCLRVVSTLLIVLCHIIKYYTFIPGSAHFNQFLDVGVQVFLLISGYLYGGKIIKDYNAWFYGRAKRIWLPEIIVVIFDVTIMALMNIKTDSITFIIYLFNLQGILFLNWRFFSRVIKEITNCGPLWFTTIIMICYLIVPLLQNIYTRFTCGKKHPAFRCTMALSGLYVITILLSAAGVVDLSCILMFIVGYSFGSLGFNKAYTGIKTSVLISLTMIFLQVIRVVLRIKISDFPYYATYTIISHAALGIWIFYIVFMIERKFPIFIRKLAENKVVKRLDSVSYYTYLVHGLFCMGTAFNVYIIIGNLWLSTVLFALMTIVSSFALNKLTDVIVKQLPR